jgi:biotin carboxyl carrier protein
MQITVNGIHKFDISKDGGNYIVNGSVVECNIQRIDNDSYQVILNNQPFIATVSKPDNQPEIKIGHQTHLVETNNELKTALEKIGLVQKTTIKSEVIKAPMPGFIVDILVREGTEIKAGQALLVLKAMKMENIIKAPHDGVIKGILVKKDQKIEKDVPMFHF